jgi:AraC-like DNA-binding protein
MFAFYTNNYRGFSDFNIIQYGVRNCEPSFAPKAVVRDSFLIHYVYKGEGYLEADGVKFPVHENQAFIIFPGQMTTYVASSENPMLYRWIGFYGDKCKEFIKQSGLSPSNPIFDDKSPYECGKYLKSIVDGGVVQPFELMKNFYGFLSSFCKNDAEKEKQAYRYIDTAVNYINYRSDAKLTVQEVADYVNVSRSFLSRVFTEKIGISPKQYILEKSMESAVLMLKNNRLSIGEIADSLGYDDVLSFTKAFTRQFKISPSKYRKEML